MTLLTILGLLVVSIPFFLFWVWVLADCAKNEPYSGLVRMKWLLFIAIAGPIGGLIYLIFRKPNRPKLDQEKSMPKSIFVPRKPNK